MLEFVLNAALFIDIEEVEVEPLADNLFHLLINMKFFNALPIDNHSCSFGPSGPWVVLVKLIVTS
jgi:hypothetical protein